jgi:hypothetical protein
MARAEALLDRGLLIPFPRTFPLATSGRSKRHRGDVRVGAIKLVWVQRRGTGRGTDRLEIPWEVRWRHFRVASVQVGDPEALKRAACKRQVSGSIPLTGSQLSVGFSGLCPNLSWNESASAGGLSFGGPVDIARGIVAATGYGAA